MAEFDAGWTWSKDMKPLVNTDSCQMTHSGYCTKGCMKITMDNGHSFDIEKDQVYFIEPGHDAHCEVDTIMLDFHR